MSRVMIIGYGPLPRPGLPYLSAPSLRTRHLLKPILEAGHTVNLFTLPIPGSEGPEASVSAMMPDNYEGLAYQRFTNHETEFAIRALSEQARQLKPDALLGINTYPAFIAAKLSTTIPLWADLNGYWMAEIQGQCWTDQDDTRLEDAWTVERAILRRLDKFSACSRAQLHAVIGEMAGIGRLNRHTFQYQFGHRIPNAAYSISEVAAQVGEGQGPFLRGPIVPPDAFIILWSGGFNVWADIPSLIEAMDQLMARYPALHFVSTGGRVEGMVTKTYGQFEELIEQSPNKERYHRLGWVPAERLARIFKESNLGINVDAPNYETMFGARNRLNTMAIEGLPIVSTNGTELAEWLEDGKAILSAPMGDVTALVAAIEPWIEQPEQLKVYAENARRIMTEDFSYEKTTRSLLSWISEPELAPDNRAKMAQTEDKLTDLNEMAANSLDEESMLLEQHPASELRQSLTELEALRSKSRRRFMFGIR